MYVHMHVYMYKDHHNMYNYVPIYIRTCILYLLRFPRCQRILAFVHSCACIHVCTCTCRFSSFEWAYDYDLPDSISHWNGLMTIRFN